MWHHVWQIGAAFARFCSCALAAAVTCAVPHVSMTLQTLTNLRPEAALRAAEYARGGGSEFQPKSPLFPSFLPPFFPFFPLKPTLL
ncbi:hypothetical protein JKP88DRAFT_225094, partial [Tribonema minus]